MTFTDAAVEVLRQLGRPLHYKEITDHAIDKNLLSHVGKSPEVTMGARLAALMKKDAPDCPLVRVKPGVFALREWDEKKIKSGLGARSKKARPAADNAETQAALAADDADAQVDVEPETEPAFEPHAASAEVADGPGDDEDDDDEVLILGDAVPAAPPQRARRSATAVVDDGVRAPEERMRAELVAGAGDMFGEEDDDDQPILGGTDDDAGDGADGKPGESQDSRRRRRRRRRGRGGANDASLPSYTATPVEGAAVQGHAPRLDAPLPRADRGERGERGDRDRDRGDRGGDRDRDRGDRGERGERADNRPPPVDIYGEGGPNFDELAGRDLADGIAFVLASFDRNLGPVSLRQLAETAQRRGKLAGEPQLAQSLVAAAVRADNHRRLAAGLRPRFRFAGGRVGLTDWLLSQEILSAEADAIAAVERYRDASRRAFAKKVAELPGHAFIELAALVLERLGVTHLRNMRRAGVPGYEAHFAASMRTAGEDVRAGIVVRRDGREIGRERVTELRGALHHYGPATLGWIITSGQVLSGAREEAAAPGAAPISLTDGYAFARLCEENDVAVIRARLPIAIPDVDLLEALRAS